MTLPAPTYDLVMLLDPQVEEDARAKILADARGAIEAQGEVLRDDDWGERALTYPIERKANAEYHLLQFHSSTPELLGGLDRSLRITDGVLRFRIIKLKPGVPDAPDMRTSSSAPRRSETEGAGEAAGSEPAVQEPAVEAELAVQEPAVQAEPAGADETQVQTEPAGADETQVQAEPDAGPSELAGGEPA